MTFIQSKLDKLLSALFFTSQIHSLLSQASPEYVEMLAQTKENISRKLGIKTSLWQEMADFLGLTDLQENVFWTKIEVFSKEQNRLAQAFLLDNIKIHKILRPRHGEGTALNSREIALKKARRIDYVECELKHSLTEFSAKPEFLKYFIDCPVRNGYSAKNITLGWIGETPVVFQRIGDEIAPMTVMILSRKDGDAVSDLSERFETEVRKNSEFRGWVCECERAIDRTVVSYLVDANLSLRHERPVFDFSILPEKTEQEVTYLIDTEIPHFIEMQKSGLFKRRGYLIEGDPGAGKSTIVKAIISSLPDDFTTVVVKPNEIGGLDRLRDMPFLFPLMIVIEDIDLILGSQPPSTLQMLLNFLDGINSPDQLITILTSAKTKEISSMLMERPGRIDRIVKIEKPDEKHMAKQIEILAGETEMPDGYSFDRISGEIRVSSLSILKELTQRSLLYSQDSKKISEDGLKKAILEMGLERKVEVNAG